MMIWGPPNNICNYHLEQLGHRSFQKWSVTSTKRLSALQLPALRGSSGDIPRTEAPFPPVEGFTSNVLKEERNIQEEVQTFKRLESYINPRLRLPFRKICHARVEEIQSWITCSQVKTHCVTKLIDFRQHGATM